MVWTGVRRGGGRCQDIEALVKQGNPPFSRTPGTRAAMERLNFLAQFVFDKRSSASEDIRQIVGMTSLMG